MAKGRFPMGGGMPGNANNMMKQVKKMQEDMIKATEEFGSREFDATSGGGAVSVKFSGNNELLAISIKPEVIDPDDVEMLEDLIISAVNEGLKTVESEKEKNLSRFTGGLSGLGGLF